LSSAQQAPITAKMSTVIDYFLREQRLRQWPLYNFNNWTPFLGVTATY